MIIRNTSTKIINIGTKILMPDDTYAAPKAICEAPSVQALVKMDQLRIEGGNDEIVGEKESNGKADAGSKSEQDKSDADKETSEKKGKDKKSSSEAEK